MDASTSNCEHKYVFMRNEQFYQENGRYSNIYTSIDYFFCEKCLDEQSRKKVHHSSDLHNTPEWAKLINKKVI
jgi:hypothetical protein